MLPTALTARWQAYDAWLSSKVFSGLDAVGFSDASKAASTITRDLPFIDSPTPAITTIATYLLIVTVGTACLKQRKAGGGPDPAWLRLLVQVHNVVLIALSACMASSAIYWAWLHNYSFWGNAYRASERNMGLTIYVFYMSKFYEFFDTIIMLLKGKVQQVSLLHVYHHASISIIWWIIARIAPGGDAYYSCALNSFVHVLMYTYYLMATLFKDERTKRKYLWWGRYLTQFQMFQFVTNMAQAAYCRLYSPYPKQLSTLLFFYMITLLVLFLNFYLGKHGGAGKKRQSAGPTNGRKKSV